jgi:hypothetical protein
VVGEAVLQQAVVRLPRREEAAVPTDEGVVDGAQLLVHLVVGEGEGTVDDGLGARHP